MYMKVYCRGTTTQHQAGLVCVFDQHPTTRTRLRSAQVSPTSTSFLCLAEWILPLPISLSVYFSLRSLHFEVAAIPPAIQAPRVQLAPQTPCSQHTMHNPAPVMPDYMEPCIETKKEEWLVLFSVVSFTLMTINAWSNGIRLFLLSIVCSLLFLVRLFFFFLACDHDFHGPLVQDKWRDMTEGWPLENVMVSMKCLNCQCCLETFKFLSYCLAVAYNVMTRWII